MAEYINKIISNNQEYDLKDARLPDKPTSQENNLMLTLLPQDSNPTWSEISTYAGSNIYKHAIQAINWKTGNTFTFSVYSTSSTRITTSDDNYLSLLDNLMMNSIMNKWGRKVILDNSYNDSTFYIYYAEGTAIESTSITFMYDTVTKL